ncbi:aspartate carbamoyltransferase catalytic subunit [Pediococcus claussenii]|uniref:Aspartate carbamoyltransferase n=1 Tax=Pediococcus claussenii (strain ATCC BAA-344 / DSM 14800 / JCM 18046 / KCTC 3811 / LMG 21948 / P06) TaxID=701521 RepID=G8PBN2_PEDCP|nr:aspartate carbamoyltransferase catalytic subunit [Pediococcus claussenii]AEV94781.1 aspartate carbamoyltransferase [Pediococcus claussenii ATCC BAA-344]ANZ69977.1 aspartate carbamoyltransferase [Pediococcus claussenii]ANZ71793.1 aspartate carbamoyltransferase [Pediococcus claussenii]KRN20960.1 pyrB protein [Pediococcus claussenii]
MITKIKNSQQDLTSIEGFNEEQILHKINLAEEYKKGRQIELKRPVYAANLFFENSTRTKVSFEMAETRLGIQIMGFETERSSIKKGETLNDTVLTLQSIGVDFTVIRHSQNEYYKEITEGNRQISIINAGDGSGQHPSQSLLDMMTIYEEFGEFSGLKILIMGDLRHSRVAHSNAQILKKLGATLYFSGPSEWYDSKFDQYGKYVAIDDVISVVDVVMLLRIQTERMESEETGFNVSQYHKKFGLTKSRAKRMGENAIIMHPAPVNRGVEIASELVESDASRIFKQMSNGVFMRMAIIEDVLAAKGLIGVVK